MNQKEEHRSPIPLVVASRPMLDLEHGSRLSRRSLLGQRGPLGQELACVNARS